MKNPSKDKVGVSQNTQLNQNKLNKTQVPPKPVENFQNTYYGQKRGNQIEEKLVGQFPPRVTSTQKNQYKVSENMTNSNIQSAKQGLQLLKKKMSRNGMSRQKKPSIQKREQNRQQQIPKKTLYKPQNENQYSNNQQRQMQKNQPKLAEKRSMKEDTSKSPPIPTKNTLNNKKAKQGYEQQYRNETEEVPIKANQDFMAILEREMAKEKQMGNMPQKEIARKPVRMDEEYEDNQATELVPCSEGCGRKFNENALEKHEKICRKVFQQKRKVFNAAEFRQPQVQDFKIPPPPQMSSNRPEKSKKQQPAKEQKIPKWKLQSAAFRASLKQGRGEQLTNQQKLTSQKANNMHQCPSCGRKFNQQAAKRHIPICQAKSKQMPKMNTRKK